MRHRMEPKQKYGRWTTISLDRVEGSKYFWNCQCECGKIKSVRSGDLVNGKSKSCGCLPSLGYTIEKAFWSKVEKTDVCWIWKGAKLPSGYGRFSVNQKAVYAHRFSYELHHGVSIGNYVIDHVCRIKSCVKPSHLEAVTQSENNWRKVFFTNKPNCPQGHPMSGSNLYVNPKTGKRRCHACHKVSHRNYYLKHKDRYKRK